MNNQLNNQLQATMLMSYMVNNESPKEIYKSYEETAHSKETRKLVLANIKNNHPEYSDDEVIIELMLAQTTAKLKFLENMSELMPIIHKESNRKEIVECLKKVIKEFEKIEGDID